MITEIHTNSPFIDRVMSKALDIPIGPYHTGKYMDYFGHSGLLRARNISVEKLLYNTEHTEKKRNEALIMGSLFHDLMEQVAANPKQNTRVIPLPDEYAVIPEGVSLRTNVGKQMKAELVEAGKEIVTAEAVYKIREMVVALQVNPTVQKLLQMDRVAEGTFLMDDFEGLPVKIRPDLLAFAHDRLICCDWKTCEDAGPRFSHDALKWGHHLQAWLYKTVLERLSGCMVDFLFVCVEKTPPYEVCIYQATPALLSVGENLFYSELLPKWTSLRDGDITGLYDFDNPIIPLDPPAWAM